ncbi:FMN-binding protein [Bacillus phage SP-15]|uniref:FMN-binding protein n=1 Tax=Bacillus phage SP-15 TaxID=1792032 RepID=A0A127AW69_9CAUD|nr:FMN-binding protein [Bacillus phage SP-15]AMM44813.1 FMN-binding protein [Bacillus phage SP-15]
MPKAQPQSVMDEKLMQAFDGNQVVLVTTKNSESQYPQTTSVSWIKALDNSSLRLATGFRSALVKNVREDDFISVAIMANETVYAIYGHAKILVDKMDGVSVPMTLIEIDIESIYKTMFWGAKVTAYPEYVKTYNVDKAEKLDEEVYSVLLQ